MEAAIATQEQLANKIEFVVELRQWDKTQIRNCSLATLHFRGGLTRIDEGVRVSSSDLKIDLINADVAANPVRPGALFRVTLERIK